MTTTSDGHSTIAFLRAVLDSTADGILVVDETGDVVTHNRRFVDVWRIPPDVVRSTVRSALVAWAASQALDAETFMAGVREMESVPSASSYHEVELRDGRILERHSLPVVLDGTARGRVICFRDVTEQRRAEQVLAASEARLRALFDHPGLGIVECRADGTVLRLNARFAAMLGYPAAELRGRRFQDFTHPDDVSRNLALRDHALEEAQPYYAFEKRYLRKDGGVVWARLSVALTRVDEREGTLLLSVIEDITEQRRLGERVMMSERLASVGAIAAGVAHEINNPLAAVLGNLRLALEDDPPVPRSPAMTQLLGDAAEAAARIGHITSELRLFARQSPVARELVDVHRALDWAARIATNEVRHRARLVKQYASTPLFVEGNEARLAQLFLNLVVNAAHAIPAGQAARHEVRIETAVADDETLLVRVSDTGRGIAPQDLALVFEPFFTTKPAGAGTGLGLAICRQIAAELDGGITVDSTPGEGATFTVTLPRSAAVRLAAPAPLPAPASPSPRRRRVLVVDDDRLVARTIVRTLQRDYDVTEVNHATAALALLQAGERFDLVLSDLMMPEMSGMDLYHALVRDHPEHARCTVFVTGGAFTDAARAFLDDASIPRLEKPFAPHALRRFVAEHLRPLDR